MAVKALAALACVNQSVLFSNLQSQPNYVILDFSNLLGGEYACTGGMDSCGNDCWASLIRWLPYGIVRLPVAALCGWYGL